jgi:hypothetical protein
MNDLQTLSIFDANISLDMDGFINLFIIYASVIVILIEFQKNLQQLMRLI